MEVAKQKQELFLGKKCKIFCVCDWNGILSYILKDIDVSMNCKIAHQPPSIPLCIYKPAFDGDGHSSHHNFHPIMDRQHQVLNVSKALEGSHDECAVSSMLWSPRRKTDMERDGMWTGGMYGPVLGMQFTCNADMSAFQLNVCEDLACTWQAISRDVFCSEFLYLFIQCNAIREGNPNKYKIYQYIKYILHKSYINQQHGWCTTNTTNTNNIMLC